MRADAKRLRTAPADIPVYVTGRWGHRRVRVTECAFVATAEEVYSLLLRDSSRSVTPGAPGQSTWAFGDTKVTAAWEVRKNRVWKYGRVFFLCPWCHRRATRLYLPTLDAPACFACRRCLGLTYCSRTTSNYKDGVPRGSLGYTHRQLAYLMTYGSRERRREAALKRRAERRSNCPR